MNLPTSHHAQRGVTLIVGMIMLVLITLMVTTAFTLSNTNLKSVGNLQLRGEVIAAANVAIEQVLSSPFTNAPAAETINVDINNDGTTDYVVAIATPVCVRVAKDVTASASSVTLGAGMSTTDSWDSVWDIEASVTDEKSGATATVGSGVRVQLTQAQKNAVCS